MSKRSKIKEFHFVVNNLLKAKIKEISLLLNLSMSKTILFILENNSALLNKIHLRCKDENNKAEKVNWDRHINIYIPEKKKFIYHFLKSIHKINNTYSIAGNLRYLLKVFVKGVQIYGLERFLKILVKAERRLQERMRLFKIWYKKRKVRQLKYKARFSVHYASNHTPILIKLLN